MGNLINILTYINTTLMSAFTMYYKATFNSFVSLHVMTGKSLFNATSKAHLLTCYNSFVSSIFSSPLSLSKANSKTPGSHCALFKSVLTNYSPSQEDNFGADANHFLSNLLLDYISALCRSFNKIKQCILFPLVQYVGRIFTTLLDGTMVYCFKLELQYSLG